MRLLVDELVVEPELEFATAVIMPLCRREMRLLLSFNNDSSILT